MRRTGGQYFPTRTDGTGYAARSLEYGGSQAPEIIVAVCGALRSGLSARDHSPAASRSISALMEIIASQKRSSSARSSDSVGSIINVPVTGNDIVGAWNP